MRIYIDEAGSFTTPSSAKPHLYSLVLALTIPSEREPDLFYQFLRVRDCWPTQSVEVKGSRLDESQASEIIDLVSTYDVLVNFFTVDMVAHHGAAVAELKARQADAIVANVTAAHHPSVVARLNAAAETTRKMSNQLFLQAFLTIELTIDVLRDATSYYVQRCPKELEEIEWFLDRKDRTTTQMEALWTELILPVSEARFAKQPLQALEGADYSYFYARYGFTYETASKSMAKHLTWVSRKHRISPPPKGKYGLDAKLLLTDRRTFGDSREMLGLQLADMLATILRRALNGNLQHAGWNNFGSLMVRKRHPAYSFLQLGPGGAESLVLRGHPKEVCLTLDASAKSMLVE